MKAYTKIKVPKQVIRYVLDKNVENMTVESQKPYKILKNFFRLGQDTLNMDDELVEFYMNLLKEILLKKNESSEESSI